MIFNIWHFWSHTVVSSHGWYMPSVTQLIRITVIVARSNQLKTKECQITLKRKHWYSTHGLDRILMQSLRIGWSKWKYLNDTSVNCGALISRSIPERSILKLFLFYRSLPFDRVDRLPDIISSKKGFIWLVNTTYQVFYPKKLFSSLVKSLWLDEWEW